ncbi:SPOR domain-containing protein [bacterium]|nr:SPOR domain-containing protein [bacterium]MBU1882970.1 SPOR domain-containing protein [bacterium]
MEERNELNDIILNKGNDAAGSSRKIILAVAILTIILIVVVMIMKNSGASSVENLPQAQDATKTNLPPEPPIPQADGQQNNSLFEPVEIVKEDKKGDEDLDKIAKKLKQESLAQDYTNPEPDAEKLPLTPTANSEVVEPDVKPEPAVKEPVVKKAPVAKHETIHTTSGKKLYIQVGSFAKYEPDKKFLSSIKTLGYDYAYHKVKSNGKTINKVLVGPFANESAARSALKDIRKNVEPGAFVTKK